MITRTSTANDNLVNYLVTQIADELRLGDHAQRQDLLIEIQETPRGGQMVTVVFDEFEPVPGSQRGGIILMALERVYGQEQALNTSVAMGLTSKEAKRLEMGSLTY